MRSPMLRTAELAPLSRELQEDTGADLFNLVVISPCQTFVSNDPTEEENVKRTPCNITSFECYDASDATTGGNAGATGPTRVTVDFDYELWHTNPDEFNQTVVQLESSMLQHLAKVFNLLDCPYVSSSNLASQRNAGVRRHLQIFGDELADLFVGVDSTPVDVKDDQHDECIVPVMESDKVSATCQPMKGRFSASVNADVSQDSMAEASIKSGLLRLLRLGMNEDLYVLNDVRKVAFIGDRFTYVPPPPPVSSASPSSGGIGTAALAIIILAALFVFLLVGFLVGRNIKKRKQDQHSKGVVLDESFALDEEEMAGASYNKGFKGGDVDSPNGSSVQGSLASTDELALQPQLLVAPVLSQSTAESDAAEESKSNVVDEEQKETPPNEGGAPVAEKEQSSTAAADELAAVLLAATAAAASAEKAGEEVTGEKISGDADKPQTPPKKKRKKKKKAKRDPDSPDSLLAESLRQLDSIAEEGEASVIEESSDSSARSLT